MKISGAVIQNRNIKTHSSKGFDATYKGKHIFITTDHGFGKPKDKYLKRFLIDVIDIETGMKDVDAYEDFYEIEDAIESALKGARLI
ncbi:hypothetical protein [Pontibacter beigongshangensis]|uniref:hypothetical protein n=1 Tax=Pontibacter beigongshangensis TaxID=2574733 RepID=UPI001650BB46|nr:hypothetical protein [Pontibacter beigongshangensis]